MEKKVLTILKISDEKYSIALKFLVERTFSKVYVLS